VKFSLPFGLDWKIIHVTEYYHRGKGDVEQKLLMKKSEFIAKHINKNHGFNNGKTILKNWHRPQWWKKIVGRLTREFWRVRSLEKNKSVARVVSCECGQIP